MSAKWRRTITSPALLAPLLFLQLRMLLPPFAARAHCWLHIQLIANQTPRAPSSELPCCWAVPWLCHCNGFCPSRGRNFLLSSLNIRSLLLAHSSSQLRSLQMAALPSAVLAAPPGLVSPANLTSTLSSLVQVTGKDVEQKSQDSPPAAHHLLLSCR